MRNFLILLACLVGCYEPPVVNPIAKPAPKVKIRLIAFTAEWCAPCRQQHPLLMRIVARGFNVQIIDVDRRPAMAARHHITAVPTYLLYINEKEYRLHDIQDVIDAISKSWGETHGPQTPLP